MRIGQHHGSGGPLANSDERGERRAFSFMKPRDEGRGRVGRAAVAASEEDTARTALFFEKRVEPGASRRSSGVEAEKLAPPLSV